MTTPAAPGAGRTVAIIGLGTVGRALGQGLRRVPGGHRVLGHDQDPDRVRAALRDGAVDQGVWNLRETVATADLVVLAEPLHELLGTLAVVAEAVPVGALITDTARVKVPVLAAARRAVPAGVSFIGGHPVLRQVPGALEPTLAGATYCLSPLPGASDAAVRAMTDLVAAMGAQPLFIDPAEHDALAAAVGDLPEILGAALAGAAARSPSARDLARLAGPTYQGCAIAPDEAVAGRATALLANAPAVVHWLDAVQDGLSAVRAALMAGDGAALTAWLDAAEAARADMVRPAEPEGRESATMAELRAHSPIRQLLLGRWGRSR